MTDAELVERLRVWFRLKGDLALSEAADRLERYGRLRCAVCLDDGVTSDVCSSVAPEPDTAFSEAFYDSHLTHALDCMREGRPYQVNADGAFALIQQAASDRRQLRAARPSCPACRDTAGGCNTCGRA